MLKFHFPWCHYAPSLQWQIGKTHFLSLRVQKTSSCFPLITSQPALTNLAPLVKLLALLISPCESHSLLPPSPHPHTVTPFLRWNPGAPEKDSSWRVGPSGRKFSVVERGPDMGLQESICGLAECLSSCQRMDWGSLCWQTILPRCRGSLMGHGSFSEWRVRVTDVGCLKWRKGATCL